MKEQGQEAAEGDRELGRRTPCHLPGDLVSQADPSEALPCTPFTPFTSLLPSLLLPSSNHNKSMSHLLFPTTLNYRFFLTKLQASDSVLFCIPVDPKVLTTYWVLFSQPMIL